MYLIKLQGFSRTTIAISFNRFKNTLTICERPSLYCFSYSPQLFVCLFVSFNRTRRKAIRTALIIMQNYKQINVQINFDHVVQYSYSLNIQKKCMFCVICHSSHAINCWLCNGIIKNLMAHFRHAECFAPEFLCFLLAFLF